jgi:hypothetical protein
MLTHRVAALRAVLPEEPDQETAAAKQDQPERQ